MSGRNEYRVPQAKAYRLWAEAYRLEAEAKTLFGFASEESISHSLDLAVAYDSMAEDMEASIATDAAMNRDETEDAA